MRRSRGWEESHPDVLDYSNIDAVIGNVTGNCFIRSSSCNSTAVKTLPRFEIGSWGTCALVGLGDNLLRNSYGKYIDAHDVVIRLGHVPVHSFERHVGSRTDLIVDRTGSLSRNNHRKDVKDVQAYLCVTRKNRSIFPKTRFDLIPGAAKIECEDAHSVSDLAFTLLGLLYRRMAPLKKPTTGTVYALRLAFSQLCSRLDVYGVSHDGGGTYYERRAITKPKHGSELDSWMLHHIMQNYQSKLNFCIYN
jgi:hypothetical protein